MTKSEIEDRLAKGERPLHFNVSSMGEYSHTWPDKKETHGHHEDKVHEELLDPREFVIYRLWSHFEGLGSDLWRVYAGVVYQPNDFMPAGPWMHLSTEYCSPFPEHIEALEHFVSTFTLNCGPHPDLHPALEFLTEHPVEEYKGKKYGGKQYAVNFPVLGMSYGEVGALQLRWLDHAAKIEFNLVSVL